MEWVDGHPERIIGTSLCARSAAYARYAHWISRLSVYARCSVFKAFLSISACETVCECMTVQARISMHVCHMCGRGGKKTDGDCRHRASFA